MYRKVLLLLLVISLFFSFMPGPLSYAQQAEDTFENPMIWADVPDPDVIRVGDVYYMTSTTMHMNPGVPIMKSYDLVHWEIVNYVYDILDYQDEQTLRNGKNEYGKGSWASSLRYHNGTFYVAFSSSTTGKTYIFQTQDIERGPWKRYTLPFYHDMSLLFDDDGRVYLVHGSGDIQIVELTSDATAVKEGGLNKVIIPDASLVAGPNVGLPAEGAHIQKINGEYYIFLITWPQGGRRTQLVFRSDRIDGPYEGRVALDDSGIAQGGIVDTINGDWYAMLFQDHGAVGRIPYLVPVKWESGWPVFGENGKVPLQMKIPVSGAKSESYIVASDEFYQGSERIGSYHTVIENRQTSNFVTASETEVRISSIEPLEDGSNHTELLVNGGMEDGLEPWTAHGAASVSVTQSVYFSGSSSLFVSGRQATGDGPLQFITGKIKVGGVYKFSAKVKYTEGPDQKRFNISIQHGPSWQGIEIMGSAVINKGEWGTIEGTYTVPKDADLSQTFIFIETTWTATPDPVLDLMDFYVDDVSFVEESVPEPQPQPPEKELLVNGGMEEGLEPWTVHRVAQVEITDREKYSGSCSLFVSGRQETGAGPLQYITGKISAGGVYKFSAKVKYTEGPDQKRFNISIQHGPSWQGIEIMGSAIINKGEWGTIEGTYTVPEDADLSQTFIFIETTWTATPDPVLDLMDFYVDDVSLIEISTGTIDQPQNGENDYNGSNLALVWQWNHNPDNNSWSLTERPGYLRLKNGRKSTGILDARNTLTQRTFGPESSASVAVEIGNMKDGDVAGLAAFQQNYGYVGVKMSGNSKSIVMVNAGSGTPQEVESVPVTQNRVYLKIEMDFKNRTDKAYFYYSLDGVHWRQIGNTLQMTYTLPHFMGYRFALFNYATKSTGGFVDFDYFRIEDKMTGTNESATVLQAELGDVPEVTGVPNMEFEVPVMMEALPAGKYSSISASLNIPNVFSVTDVKFNSANIVGNTSYQYAGNRLQLEVTGDEVDFSNPSSGLFATIKLKVNRFIPSDRTVEIRMDYVKVAGGNILYNVHDAAARVGLKALNTGAIAKIPGYFNPLISHKFGADPHAVVYNGRVYLYMSSDEYEYDHNGNIRDNTYQNLTKVYVISSDDLVNWTDHGAIPVAGPNGIAKWADRSFAPAVAYKKINGVDKFFLYFGNGGGGIGVLTADSPIGPWTDPLGGPLVTWSTPGVAGVVWLFDPAVLVDDDGNAYMYFGGGIPGGSNPSEEQIAHPMTARVIRLGEDMISTVGSAVPIDAPYFFEASGINKYNGKYYYSYSVNFSGTRPPGTPPTGSIAYMISDNPMGPFTYGGTILRNPGEFFEDGGNNHHYIFQLNHEWYIAYHAQTRSRALIGQGKGYRSPHINKLEFYENGTIKEVQADREGVPPIKNLNPYVRTEAETIAWSAGISTESFDVSGSQVPNLYVTAIDQGDWLAVANVDFGENGAASFEANIASNAEGKIEIRLDSPIGDVIGTLDVHSTGGQWEMMKTEVSNAKGVHHIFFMFSGEGGSDLFNIDYWQFHPAGPGTDVIPVQSVRIMGGSESIRVGELATMNAMVHPPNATNPTYRWEASGAINIVGASDQNTVTVRGVHAGTGTLKVTVEAGGAEKTAEKTITVKGVGNNDQSGPGNGGSAPTAPQTGSNRIDILINGKAVTAGTATTSDRNGQRVTVITIDPSKLNHHLSAGDDGAVITIPATGESAIAIIQLDGQTVKMMEDRNVVLEIKTDRATHTLPARQINIGAVSQTFGSSVHPQDVTIEIEVGVPSADLVKKAEQAAEREKFTLLAPPVTFMVTAKYGDKSSGISKFNAYIKRFIAIPDGVDPNAITTGIAIEPDGTVRHVPTKVVVMGGKSYAQVSSLTTGTYAIVSHSLAFRDVTSHWAREAVNDLGSRMVVNGVGDGLFNPDATITRAEFAAIIVRALGLKMEGETAGFSDVKATAWYSDAVATARSHGLIDGFENGTFRPQDKITREQAMTILAKAMALTGLKAKLSSTPADDLLKPYSDAADVSGWAKSGVTDCIHAGIVSGRSATVLAPKAEVTRAEVSKMIQNLLQKSDLI